MRYALFPLNTVVFPGTLLPLQVFEQRYLSLVSECMKQDTGFVIVLISQGQETGTAPQIYQVGCYVEIIDWESLPNGLLGISVRGKYRVRLSNSSVRDDGLLMADCEILTSDLEQQPDATASVYGPLTDMLRSLLQHPYARRYMNLIDYENRADICYRLSELLPISNRQKQLLLESETAQQLVDQLTTFISKLQA
jgi:Lon protease-like protein